jgi:hypothetical protein
MPPISSPESKNRVCTMTKTGQVGSADSLRFIMEYAAWNITMTEGASNKRGTLGLLEVASRLGMKPRYVKQAINSGDLPPSEISPAYSFALTAFSHSWLKNALGIIGDNPSIRSATYGRKTQPINLPGGVKVIKPPPPPKND